MIQDTSLHCYYREVLPTLSDRQRTVIEAFVSTERSFTNNELKVFLGWEINTVTPRVNELVKAQILRDAGKRICSVTGRLAHIWELTPRSVPQLKKVEVPRTAALFEIAPTVTKSRSMYAE